MLNAQRLFHDKLLADVGSQQGRPSPSVVFASAVDFSFIEGWAWNFLGTCDVKPWKRRGRCLDSLCLQIVSHPLTGEKHPSSFFCRVQLSQLKSLFLFKGLSPPPLRKDNFSMEFASLVQIRAISSGGDILLTASDVEVWGLLGVSDVLCRVAARFWQFHFFRL